MCISRGTLGYYVFNKVWFNVLDVLFFWASKWAEKGKKLEPFFNNEGYIRKVIADPYNTLIYYHHNRNFIYKKFPISDHFSQEIHVFVSWKLCNYNFYLVTCYYLTYKHAKPEASMMYRSYFVSIKWLL